MMMKNNLEEKKDMLLEEITEKLECLINGFEKVLYDDDDIFLQNMTYRNTVSGNGLRESGCSGSGSSSRKTGTKRRLPC